MMQAVENRMVLGEYYEDDPREYILDTAKPADYAGYVYDSDERMKAVLSRIDINDLWEHLDTDFVDTLCQRWVEKNNLDDFVDWKKEHQYH